MRNESFIASVAPQFVTLIVDRYSIASQLFTLTVKCSCGIRAGGEGGRTGWGRRKYWAVNRAKWGSGDVSSSALYYAVN